jgi:hypothetical protein
MDHMPWLVEHGAATATSSGESCGHALMASCPPQPFDELDEDGPFGGSNIPPANKQPVPPMKLLPGLPQQQRTWELTKADLTTLLDLSRRLELDGEITPVMAWGMVLAHPRRGELRSDDCLRLVDELSGKVRCYGYETPPPTVRGSAAASKCSYW